MIKLNKDKIQIRYITGIGKSQLNYPTALDILYESCVENADETLVVIYTQGGMLYIEGVETDYNIFDATGRLIYNGRDAVMSLPRGVYMLNVGDKTYKVAM